MILPEVHPFLASIACRPVAAARVPAHDDPAWRKIVEEALRHGLLFVLHRWSMSPEGEGRIPAGLRAKLATEAAGATARHLVLADELRSILALCRDAGIDCAPLRGLALAERLCGPGAQRPTGDIDLLVRRKDLAALSGLLAGLGFASLDHRPGFAGDFSYTLTFVKDRHGWLVVEPHWTLAYPPFAGTLDMEAIWSRCRRGRVAGIEAWRLSDEDLVLHLCFHLLHHGNGAPLLWWHELDLLIAPIGRSLNWRQVVTTAESSGQSVLVHEVLRTLVDRFNTPVPAATVALFAVGPVPASTAMLLAGGPALEGREEFAQLLSLPGWRAKVRYALGLLFPSPGYMVRRYAVRGRAGLGTAYVTRLLHLAWEGLRWTGALLSARATLSR